VFRVSKPRTALAILAAASSVAAATGPIASTASAADNGPTDTGHQSLCDSLHNSYNDLLLIAQVNVDTGNHSDAIRAQLDAKRVRDQAYNEGCKWATGRVVPKKPGISGAVHTTHRPSAR
jgi:hypothetical protein